jgi:hypothetical protein
LTLVVPTPFNLISRRNGRSADPRVAVFVLEHRQETVLVAAAPRRHLSPVQRGRLDGIASGLALRPGEVRSRRRHGPPGGQRQVPRPARRQTPKSPREVNVQGSLVASCIFQW